MRAFMSIVYSSSKREKFEVENIGIPLVMVTFGLSSSNSTGSQYSNLYWRFLPQIETYTNIPGVPLSNPT